MKKPLKETNEAHLLNRWAYVILSVIIMLCLGTVYSWGVFRLSIEQLYAIGTTQSGLPYMTSLAFYSLFMFLAGKYLSRFNPRFVITLGGIIVAIGWILSAYAPNILTLTLTYGVIMGSGVGISYGVPISVATRWFPDKKGLIVGIVLFGFGLSPLITAPIASYFVNNYGVMKAFLLLGIAYFIIIPLLSYPMRCPENAAYSTTLNNVSKNTLSTHGSAMVQTKSFKGLYLNFMFGTMIGLMLIGMTNTIGVEFMQLSSDQVVLLMPLFAIFNGIGRPALGWLTDKYSIRTAMLISYGLIILAALLMLTSDPGSLLIYSISFSIFWFNLGGWLAIAPTSTLTLYGPKYYTQNYGIVFTSYGIGAIIGVYASGVLVDTFKNYYSVFYLVISICIIGIIASQRLLPKKV